MHVPNPRPATRHAPEFLRPEYGFEIRLRRPVPRRRPSWSYAPATYSLVAVNYLVFLVMVWHNVSAASPNLDQLMYWGADDAGSVLIQGEW